MNWLVLVVIGLLALNVYLGYRNGFLKVVLSLVGWIVILGAASVGSPYLSAWICRNTSIDDIIKKRIMDRQPAKNSIIDLSKLFDGVADNISAVIITGLSFVLIIIIGIVIYILLRKLLGLANKLPIIGGVNKSAGAALGFIKGCIFVWIIFAVTSMSSSTQYGQQMIKLINESDFLMAFYDNNVILSTIHSML